MQSSPSLSGWETIILEVARFLASGGIGSALTLLITRRRQRSEVSLNEAKARQVDGETIAKAIDQINELWDDNDRLRERNRIVMQNDDKKAIEIELLQHELQWLSAVLKINNIKLSDYDHLRRPHQLGD